MKYAKIRASLLGIAMAVPLSAGLAPPAEAVTLYQYCFRSTAPYSACSSVFHYRVLYQNVAENAGAGSNDASVCQKILLDNNPNWVMSRTCGTDQARSSNKNWGDDAYAYVGNNTGQWRTINGWAEAR